MRAPLSAGQRLGATILGDDDRGTCEFVVWASRQDHVAVRLQGSDGERLIPMQKQDRGYFDVRIEGVRAGDRYWFRLNNSTDRPDPASRFQPEGVHGSSQIVDRRFQWTAANWSGVPLEQCVFYELHIGTFTSEGTLDAVIPHLDGLHDLGVTMVEIMPVAQFPGTRNWGYDGAAPFAVQNSYGGPDGMKRLIDACHQRGLGVTLDVVYNHLGPEGNYLSDFGDYFTGKYHTPWGNAMNFDGPGSDEVRRFFIENALMWVDEFRVDALRLDAVHAIFDQSAYPFLHELTDAVHALAEQQGRRVHVIAESDLNDPRLIRPADRGGFGMDAQWSDDLHHSLHALLTGERDGYYADFGSLSDLARALSDGYVYTGQYSSYRQCRHGAPPTHVPAHCFVVCSQNHDQVGNRAMGDRLRTLVSFEQYKVAAAVVLLSPYRPLLFMGEEYGEIQPFQYFVSHSDKDLVEAVRQGRQDEFASFRWQSVVPDPQSEETFRHSRLDRTNRDTDEGRGCLELYKALLEARRNWRSLAQGDLQHQRVICKEQQCTLLLHRWGEVDQTLLAINFSADTADVTVDLPSGLWATVLESTDARFAGPGRSATCDSLIAASEVQLTLAPHSFLLLAHAVEHDGEAES